MRFDEGVERISVSHDQLSDHAAALRRLALRADQVESAARLATLDVGAYGLMCSALPRTLMPAQTGLVSAMRDAATEIDAVAAALTMVADDYRAADAKAAMRIAETGGGRRG